MCGFCGNYFVLEADGDLYPCDFYCDSLNRVASLSDEITAAAKDYDPSRITRYVYDTATLFHKFYNACRVKNDNEALMQARLSLCLAVRTVIANILTMFKISAPTSM